MDVEQLKESVAAYRKHCQTKKGMVFWSEGGPASIGLIEELVEAVETLDKRIKALESEKK